VIRHLRNQHGFSLAELLVTTAIIGVVMAGIFVIQRSGQQAYLFGSNRVETQQNARVALDLMTRELRSSTCWSTPPLPGCPAPSTTVLASPTDITFVWDDGASHIIRYWQSGTNLNRTFDGTTTPLIGGVHTLAMTYYSVYDVGTTTYTETSNVNLVKVIKISVRTKTEDGAAVGSPGDAQALMESTVTLRSNM
jgi:prepilin-type N-terminal cleavage/methylation domain-containing protein